MINEEQVQVGVDVVERSTTDVVERSTTDVARIETDLAKTILNIVEQEIVILAPMVEQGNANRVVDIVDIKVTYSTLLIIIYWPIHPFY
jgi:hypothetical protein